MALIRDAETQLISCGVTDVGERLSILRGIYYGTPGAVISAPASKATFAIRCSTFTAAPANPQPHGVYGLRTFLAIGASQT